jgi:hypothetical protein
MISEHDERNGAQNAITSRYPQTGKFSPLFSDFCRHLLLGFASLMVRNILRYFIIYLRNKKQNALPSKQKKTIGFT